eukprot:COSAG05_NODE_893_length_6708_cov_2.153427_5_plen_107_part_00
MAGLRQLFSSYDSDGDAKLGIEELCDGLAYVHRFPPFLAAPFRCTSSPYFLFLAVLLLQPPISLRLSTPMAYAPCGRLLRPPAFFRSSMRAQIALCTLFERLSNLG